MNKFSLETQLATLGLNRYEAAVYVGLLGRSQFTASEIATYAGVPRQRIYDVLQQNMNLFGLLQDSVVGVGRAFQILDKKYEALFWRYFTNDAMHTFYSKDDGAKFINTPWWMMEQSSEE